MPKLDAKDMIALYGEAKSLRSPFEGDFRLCAAYCLPRQFSAWGTEGPTTQSLAGPRRLVYDNTGIRCIPKYSAVLNRLATPDNQKWQVLTASNKDLMKSYPVQLFFMRLTDKLFQMRYNARSRFIQTRGEVYTGLGVYGTSPYSITWRKPSVFDPRGGFAYKAWPLYNVFILTDDEGNTTHIFRRFWLNARQYRMKPQFQDASPPKSIKAELDKPSPSETNFFEFIQVLCLRDDYEKDALNYRRHPIAEYYMCVPDNSYVGEESGYQSWPMNTPRTYTEADTIYGYSPAQQGLSTLGGVSAMKKTVLKQGHKAVSPPIFVADDGVLSGRIDVRPDAVNKGGVSKDGKKLFATMDPGNFSVAEKLIQDERADIEDTFFVTLFRVLEENPSMTATQVVELMATRGALLAPTMGRLQSEDIGPMTEREISLLAENNMLVGDLEMPPELIEARGEYTIQYTSALALAQQSEEASGFLRWTEWLERTAAATQDASYLDYADYEEAAPEIARAMAVRPNWVSSGDRLAEKRKARQEATQQQQIVDQAPAIASVMNTALKSNTGTAKGAMN